MVLSNLLGDDLILCQITSKMIKDCYAIEIADTDFATGGLMTKSNIRLNRLFTADRGIILYKIGTLENSKIREVIEGVVNILRNSRE